MAVEVESENDDLKYPIDSKGQPYFLIVLKDDVDEDSFGATVEYENMHTDEDWDKMRYALTQFVLAI